MIDSMTLHAVNIAVRQIGREAAGSCRAPFLNIGATWPCFQSDGTVPSCRPCMKRRGEEVC